MNMAAWGVVVLVVLPLLQFPVIVYLSRRIETDGELPPPSAWESGASPPDPERSQPAAESSRTVAESAQSPPTEVAPNPPRVTVCPRCGVENDPAFTYCRDCVARLR